jgi:MHS family alpha-ketoglutarate permease-like MFS transporter
MASARSDAQIHLDCRSHPSDRSRLKAIIGGAAGNFIEWFDWFAYASFSLYFAKVFFPHQSEIDQRLEAAGVFAIGFLARPAGAWIMGVFADRRGRKAALVLSVAMMCAGSLVVAVTPGYGVIGVAAPIILILARLLQGLSLGGEYGASATYMSEMAGRARRGFWSSFQFVTIIAGQISALGVLILLQRLLTPEQLNAWGWRVPFFIGAALALIVWAIQSGLEESAAFAAEDLSQERRSTTLLLFTHYPKETAMIFILTSAGSISFYCYTTYMQKFLTGTAHYSKAMATDISAASLVMFLFIQPLFGWIGDKIGRRALLAFAFGAGALTTWPIMTAIGASHAPLLALGLVCAALFILAGYTAVNAVVKSELFPTRVRALGVALPYALANAVFGGTAELAAETFKKVGLESGFYLYVSAILALGCIVALRMRDTQKTSLIAED